jgi:hypothetical protein
LLREVPPLPDCIFFPKSVNALRSAHVVGTSQEFFQMNRNEILSAWPEDERDRKRAPARF